MPEADAATLPFNPFNLTKVWPQGDYPLIEVGQWELNRNPENYFAEVEQAAFAPSRVVPGIGFSPDKMLHGRLFSYPDAQYYRLGVNHQTIPVNAPRCPVHSYHRDGAMRVDGNYGSTLHYEPNSYGQWQEQPDYRTPPEPLGDVAGLRLELPRGRRRLLHPARRPVRADDTSKQRQALFDNTARSMHGVPGQIQQRWIGLCTKADPAYGAGVAKAIAELEAQLAGCKLTRERREGSRGVCALAPIRGPPAADKWRFGASRGDMTSVAAREWTSALAPPSSSQECIMKIRSVGLAPLLAAWLATAWMAPWRSTLAPISDSSPTTSVNGAGRGSDSSGAGRGFGSDGRCSDGRRPGSRRRRDQQLAHRSLSAAVPGFRLKGHLSPRTPPPLVRQTSSRSEPRQRATHAWT